MEHCEPKYTGTDTNHLLYHQPTDGAPHDNTPRLYVSQRRRLFIHALEESMEHCEPKYTGTDTNHLLYHQPTDGAPHDNTPPPRVVCSTATEIIYPCPRRINGALWTEIHRDRHQSFAISPTHGRSPTRQYPPPGCMYHSGRDYLSMP